MKSTILKIKSTLLLALLSLNGMAQDAAATTQAADVPNPNSMWNTEELLQPLALAMIAIILLLFFAILAMAKVMKQSSLITRLRIINQKHGNKAGIIIFLLSLFSINNSIAQGAAAAAPPPAKMIGGLSQFSFYLLFTIIVIMVLALIAMARAFKYTLGADAVEKLSPEADKVKKLSWWERVNKTKSLEGVDEATISTGHDYDGIGELDNPTPPWWNFMFILGIVFAVGYMWVYHVTHSAPNQYEAFEKEQKEAQAIVAANLAKAGNNVDENTVKLSTEAADLDAGKAIFAEKCVSCHLADGGGSVGPNLTDDNWIHGCTINDIFKTVKYGVVEKGMTPWKDQLTPKQIAQVSSYVVSLHGTKPAVPKAPQGDPCTAAAATPQAAPADGAAPATDTTKPAKTDSSVAKK